MEVVVFVAPPPAVVLIEPLELVEVRVLVVFEEGADTTESHNYLGMPLNVKVFLPSILRTVMGTKTSQELVIPTSTRDLLRYP